MLIAVDVHYAEHATTTAAVGFFAWSDAASAIEHVGHDVAKPAPYAAGAFYRRELPFILRAVTEVERRHPVEAVIVDGHVWLREGEPGLGARSSRGVTRRPTGPRRSVPLRTEVAGRRASRRAVRYTM